VRIPTGSAGCSKRSYARLSGLATFADVPVSRGEFHQGWDNVVGWGRAVTVRSTADLQLVRRFIADSGDFRRAVMLQNVTSAERHALVAAIEHFGVKLTEFTKSDKKRIEHRPFSIKEALMIWVMLILSLPYRIVLLLQRRKSVMLVMTPRSEGGGSESTRPSG